MIKYVRTSEEFDSLLTLKDAKDYMRVDYDFEDNYICNLIDDMVDWAEKQTRIPWFRGDYNMRVNLQCASEPDYAKIDPYYDFRDVKVHSIDQIKTYNIEGESTELVDGVDYRFDADLNRLYFPTMKNIARYSALDVDIDHMLIKGEFGWTQNTLPGDLHTALKALVAYAFENRGLDENIPQEVINLIGHYKRWY